MKRTDYEFYGGRVLRKAAKDTAKNDFSHNTTDLQLQTDKFLTRCTAKDCRFCPATPMLSLLRYRSHSLHIRSYTI
jgi:hypothetical protein